MTGLVVCIEIAAAIFADLDDGVVVFARDLRNEVVDAARPYLKAGLGEWAFRGHFDVDLGYGVAGVPCSPSISVPKCPPVPDEEGRVAFDTTRRV
jgi:hypothetical protein